jgi:hypothetical protein
MLIFQQLFTFFKACCSIIRLAWKKSATGTNTLAYFGAEEKKKSFIGLTRSCRGKFKKKEEEKKM